MTLMPVSNTSFPGSSESKAGASRWMSHQASIFDASSAGTSSGSPITLVTWRTTPSPTGIDRPLPRLRTAVPRVRPSVGLRQMARTRDSPICWATSARTATVSPPTSTVISRAVLMPGTASGGNSTSTTGPAMATTRPSLSVAPVSVLVSVAVIACAPRCLPAGGFEAVGQDVGGHERVVDQQVAALCLGGAHGLGAADDLHDLGGDGVLAGPVHGPRVAGDQVVGVVGGRLHGPLLGGEERSGAVQQGGVEAGLRGARPQPILEFLPGGPQIRVGP